jgi:hypothetical protein
VLGQHVTGDQGNTHTYTHAYTHTYTHTPWPALCSGPIAACTTPAAPAPACCAEKAHWVPHAASQMQPPFRPSEGWGDQTLRLQPHPGGPQARPPPEGCLQACVRVNVCVHVFAAPRLVGQQACAVATLAVCTLSHKCKCTALTESLIDCNCALRCSC